MRNESDVLKGTLADATDAFPADTVRVATVAGGVLHFVGGQPSAEKQVWTALGEAIQSLGTTAVHLDRDRVALVVPVVVAERAAGVLMVERAGRAFSEQDRWLMELLASRLSVSVENARLYHQLTGLFRQYTSADVASALIADPEQAALGGALREVTVLFADLRGFTSFAEQFPPEHVVAMLNRYFGVAAPVVIAHGGTVTTFIGDALMALFNAPTYQSDHALHAARAALALQAAIEDIAADRPDWPRFKVGVNTGPALVGNIGSTERRTYTAIGDTVNLAARLESCAEAGQVVIGPRTYAVLGPLAVTHPLGALHVKGRRDPVDAFALTGLCVDEEAGRTRTLRIEELQHARHS